MTKQLMVKYGIVEICVAVGCINFGFVSCVKKDHIIELVITGLTGFLSKNNFK